MATRLGDTPDACVPIDSHAQNGVHPQLTLNQSVGYSGMPLHMYPFSGTVSNPRQIRAKRRQVKNACTNCQKACKKCDDARPCLRCVKYGVIDECIDSQRKERRKGVKRGPYKKRDVKGRAAKSPEAETSQAPQAIAIPAVATSASPPTGQFMAPVAFPPGLFTQYPPPNARSGEAGPYFPQFYITQMPPPTPTANGDGSAYPPQPQFYPALIPYGPPFASYVVPHQRPDGQFTFASYPMMYQRPPSTGDPGTSSGQYRMDTRMTREQEEEEEEEADEH